MNRLRIALCANEARVAALIAACAVGGCETPATPSVPDPYDFRLTVSQPDGPAADLTFHWELGATVYVFLPEPEKSGRPSIRSAFVRAARVWTDAAVFGEVTLRETEELGSAGAVLGWRDGASVLSTPLNCLGPIAGAASTRGCLNDEQNALRSWPRRDGGQSGVLFRVVVEPTADQAILDRLVIHEMGHVLGILRHSNQPEDVMSGGPLMTDRLSPRDLSTLRALYQTPVDLPPELSASQG